MHNLAFLVLKQSLFVISISKPSGILVVLAVMKPGSVCVNLAAAIGGNVAQTQPDTIVTTSNGVKIIGFTDLPSRLTGKARNLFGNNVAKFILSIGPPTTNKKGFYQIDFNDDAVQNMLIACNGERRFPDKRSYSPPLAQKKDIEIFVVNSKDQLLDEKNEKKRVL